MNGVITIEQDSFACGLVYCVHRSSGAWSIPNLTVWPKGVSCFVPWHTRNRYFAILRVTHFIKRPALPCRGVVIIFPISQQTRRRSNKKGRGFKFFLGTSSTTAATKLVQYFGLIHCWVTVLYSNINIETGLPRRVKLLYEAFIIITVREVLIII